MDHGKGLCNADRLLEKNGSDALMVKMKDFEAMLKLLEGAPAGRDMQYHLVHGNYCLRLKIYG